MEAQLAGLISKRFIQENDYQQLSHFPRYLKGIGVRMEKLRSDPLRDQKNQVEWNTVALGWQRLNRQAQQDPKMQEYRWLLEELRISLYAQELKTPMPVSAKRLQKVWDSLQR